MARSSVAAAGQPFVVSVDLRVRTAARTAAARRGGSMRRRVACDSRPGGRSRRRAAAAATRARGDRRRSALRIEHRAVADEHRRHAVELARQRASVAAGLPTLGGLDLDEPRPGRTAAPRVTRYSAANTSRRCASIHAPTSAPGGESDAGQLRERLERRDARPRAGRARTRAPGSSRCRCAGR